MFLDPFPSLDTKVTFHRLFLLASKRKGAKEGLKHGAIFGVLWAFCFFLTAL